MSGQRYGNIQSPIDPYSGVQLSAIRYSGYRAHHFHMSDIERRRTLAEVKGAIKFVGGVALVAVGFYALLLLGSGATV